MKNIFSLLSSFLSKKSEVPPLFTGVVITGDEVTVDTPTFGEIVASANAVEWKEKTQAEWRKFPVLDQKSSYMCGAFSVKKLAGIYYYVLTGKWIDFSEEDFYQRRSNRPDPGIAIGNLYSLLGEGLTLKCLTAANIVTDADAEKCVISNEAKQVRPIFAMGRMIAVTNPTVDTIASIIATTGKALLLMTGFTYEDWARFDTAIVSGNINLFAKEVLRHYAVITDYTLYNGKKKLIVDDSAHFGGFSQRLIGQEWLDKRTICVTYPMNFKFQGGGDKPSFDGSIISAQKCYRYEGLFPTNVSFTESEGPVTREATRKFQVKYGIDQTGTLGPRTRGKLQELYP